jgi:putative membrane protein
MSDQAPSSRNLGFERTRMSSDRTLMAWIRTCVSMISFGFSIYKFFIYLRESGFISGTLHMYGPRNLGLALVVLGTLLMGFAAVEYFFFQRSLSRQFNRKFRVSTVLIASLLISVVGILALINLLYNIGPL